MKPNHIYVLGILFMSVFGYGQDIDLFQQFNGRYDYTAIGNTLNSFENNLDQSFCEILPSSQATLTLEADQNIIAAYLYWAGSGEADTDILLNGIPITSQINYNVSFNSSSGELVYFSCFSDITDFIISEGNITYELSELDISEALTNPGYCGNRTNFAGWGIYVIYEEATLPLNQISLFQGMEIINTNVNETTIELENINVLDNQGAKIGFLAWEGDNALNFGESLSINDNVLSNPPLNLSDNAFNGTNTFTNSDTFYNADLDVYNIQDNIAIGDTSATIKLTTGDFDENGVFRADLIILNNIITVLNSQLPDATVTIDDLDVNCNSNLVSLDYTIFNVNSTAELPAGTPIAFYVDNILVAQSTTQNTLPIGGSELNSIAFNIPDFAGSEFNISIIVDDDGTGSGTVNETNETNNFTTQDVILESSAPIIQLPNLLDCDLGLNTAIFDLTEVIQNISSEFDTSDAQFYTTLEDAENQQNEILNTTNFINTTDPQTIYNRFGTLIFVGNNDLKWYGKSNKGLNDKGKLLPVGTYFYVLHLNDPNYRSLTGWVYLNY